MASFIPAVKKFIHNWHIILSSGLNFFLNSRKEPLCLKNLMVSLQRNSSYFLMLVNVDWLNSTDLLDCFMLRKKFPYCSLQPQVQPDQWTKTTSSLSIKTGWLKRMEANFSFRINGIRKLKSIQRRTELCPLLCQYSISETYLYTFHSRMSSFISSIYWSLTIWFPASTQMAKTALYFHLVISGSNYQLSNLSCASWAINKC